MTDLHVTDPLLHPSLWLSPAARCPHSKSSKRRLNLESEPDPLFVIPLLVSRKGKYGDSWREFQILKLKRYGRANCEAIKDSDKRKYK
jgi:hypothetical protein